MTLGFLGTGALTAAMVTGFNSTGVSPVTIRVSPRNTTVAASLASRFESVSVCASNQEVLDGSETVILAVRPQVAGQVLSGLHFSSSQIVISVVAGFPVRRVAELVAPAQKIWRAIPLPSVAQRRSPIALFPAGGPPAELFGMLGQVFGIEKEDHLNALSTATSTMAAYFSFIGHIASWVARKGLPERQCREYVARMFAGLADAGLEVSEQSFEALATAHATPGGLNEQVLRDLTGHGVFDTLTEALDSVHRRATNASA